MRTVDYLVVALYLSAVFFVSILSRGRKRSADEYFSAHGTFKGKLGSLLIGLSIAASFFSGISFIVYSSFAYSVGLQILTAVFGLPIAWLFLRFWFLDRYLASGSRHPYDVVEQHFGYRVRATLSLMFVLLRIGWMAVIIYAPTLIIIGALGLQQTAFWPIVLIVGGTCTLVSAVGGIRGVIVTDAIQFLIIALGLVLIAVSILARMHWALGGMWSDLRQGSHLHMFDLSFSFTQPWTVWAIIIGSTVSSLGQYMSDQMSLQRYLASESREALFRSFVINLVGVIGVILMLVSVGLLLFVWYRHFPDPALPHNADQVLPYFAARRLPVGMSGLLVAAILAATMNTLTSGINSLAGAITNDFVSRIGRKRTGDELFRFGRLTSVSIGLLSTLAAGFADYLGNILQATNIVMGSFFGPMLGCMVLVISRSSVRSGAVLAGMIVGSLVGIWVATSPASSYWISPAGFAASLAVPWADALFFRRQSR